MQVIIPMRQRSFSKAIGCYAPQHLYVAGSVALDPCLSVFIHLHVCCLFLLLTCMNKAWMYELLSLVRCLVQSISSQGDLEKCLWHFLSLFSSSFPSPQLVVVVFLFLFPLLSSQLLSSFFFILLSLESRYNNIMVFNKYGCSNLFSFPLFSGFGHWDIKLKLRKAWVIPFKCFFPFLHPPYF